MNARAMRRLIEGLPNDPTQITGTATFQVINPTMWGKILVPNLAGTVTIQLPNSTGSGMYFEVYVGTNSAGQTVIVQRGLTTDRLQGSVFIGIHNSTSGKVFQASQTTNANTVTLNGTTQGGVSVGDTLLFTDIATGIWSIQGTVVGSGSIATPFSNT